MPTESRESGISSTESGNPEMPFIRMCAQIITLTILIRLIRLINVLIALIRLLNTFINLI